MLTNCRITCPIDVLYRSQRTEGPGCNGGQAACIMGQWPQLVWQVATVLISPILSLLFPLSDILCQNCLPTLLSFPASPHTPVLFFSSKHKIIGLFSLGIVWGLTVSNVCTSAFLATKPPTFFNFLLPSASILRHAANIQKHQKTTFDPK